MDVGGLMSAAEVEGTWVAKLSEIFSFSTSGLVSPPALIICARVDAPMADIPAVDCAEVVVVEGTAVTEIMAFFMSISLLLTDDDDTLLVVGVPTSAPTIVSHYVIVINKS